MHADATIYSTLCPLLMICVIALLRWRWGKRSDVALLFHPTSL
jgi:hypothetical protein